MKNVVEFPDMELIKKQAASWLIRLDSEEALSNSEHACLGQWLHRSPAHYEQLKKLADLWGKLNTLTELAVPLGQLKQKKNDGFWHYGFGVSAIAMMVAIVFIFGSFSEGILVPIADVNRVYATAIGAQKPIELLDGSVLLLNTNTQVKVDYRENFRDIYLLKGEAHFSVAKNLDRPFRVFAGDGRIDAVGTAFSVYLRESAVDVTVTEGRVVLTSVNLPREALDNPVVAQSNNSGDTRQNVRVGELGLLTAGQAATIETFSESESQQFNRLNNLRDIKKNDLSRQMSWTEGVLLFSGESLSDVVKEISRYTAVSIEFSDPAVGAIRVGGVFPVGETDTMFNALETTFGLHVAYLSEGHVLVSAGN